MASARVPPPTSRPGAPTAGRSQTARFVGATVLVGFRTGASEGRRQRLMRRLGARDLRVIGAGTHVLRLARTSVPAAIAVLRRDPSVRYAEPDYIASASASAVPKDPSFGLQWGSQNTGQSIPFQDATEKLGTAGGGTPAADDRANWAWNSTQGSQGIVIGETDSGVNYNHPDLATNIWANPQGVGGCPAGTHGYNVVPSTPTCDPMDDDTEYGGHGTHVAGIMGAVGDNSAGVAGMNWRTTILPVKWLDSTGSGTTAGLISALSWLLSVKQAGVNLRVVNDSATFVGTAYSQALSNEIDVLGANNILFVTAAGNTGQNNDSSQTPRYPCNYHRANEICVTASDHNDSIPSWANYGPGTVDLAAPGVSIFSTLRNGSYGWLSGGSMASPQVAGAAALVLANNPTLSVTDVKNAILDNVDPIPGMSGLVRTGGRLDVCKAIPGCQQPALAATAQATPGSDGSSAVLNGAVSPQNTNTNFHFRYSLNSNMSGATNTGAQSAGSAGTSAPVSQNVTGLQANAKYYFQIEATNAAGTTDGAIRSFSTSLVGPAVSTQPASSLTGSSAVLDGTVNPENSPTTYRFDYSPSPDMSGASSTPPQSAGSGATGMPVSQPLAGLQPNTTYYFRIVATDAAQITSTGPVVSFVTSAPPLAATQPAQSIGPVSAVLSASVNPQNSPTSYVFEYSPNADMSGARQVPQENPLTVGSGDSPAAVSQPVSGLAPGTTYYFRVVATNEAGPVRTAEGSVLSFTTLPRATAVTLPAASVGSSSAVLSGLVNPRNSWTVYVFRYSTRADMTGATQPHGPSPAGSDGSSHLVTQAVSGLAPQRTYYFQVIAVSPAGITPGAVLAFTTAALSFRPPGPVAPTLSDRVPPGQTITSLLAHGLRVRVRASTRCSLSAVLLRPVVQKLSAHKRRTTTQRLASESRTLAGNRTLQFSITLSRSARRALAHSTRITLTLQLSAGVPGIRTPTTKQLRITLVRPTRPRRR
ncbi:MAG: S8 family serine peptidase [Solirubrobacteraceae bacterium]